MPETWLSLPDNTPIEAWGPEAAALRPRGKSRSNSSVQMPSDPDSRGAIGWKRCQRCDGQRARAGLSGRPTPSAALPRRLRSGWQRGSARGVSGAIGKRGTFSGDRGRSGVGKLMSLGCDTRAHGLTPEHTETHEVCTPYKTPQSNIYSRNMLYSSRKRVVVALQ